MCSIPRPIPYRTREEREELARRWKSREEVPTYRAKNGNDDEEGIANETTNTRREITSKGEELTEKESDRRGIDGTGIIEDTGIGQLDQDARINMRKREEMRFGVSSMIQEYDANKDEEVPPRIWGDWDGGLREQEKQNEEGARDQTNTTDWD